jgi:hypothetical protein
MLEKDMFQSYPGLEQLIKAEVEKGKWAVLDRPDYFTACRWSRGEIVEIIAGPLDTAPKWVKAILEEKLR